MVYRERKLLKDRTGQRWGIVVVVGPGQMPGTWRVRCECGIERDVPGDYFANNVPPKTHLACRRERDRLHGVR